MHKVVPMLPHLLCENLCSLNPNVERLAYSISFLINEDGELVRPEQETRVFRSVIKSCAKWHYQLVQEVLDGKVKNVDDLEEKLVPTRNREYSLTRVGFSFEDLQQDCFKLARIARNRRKRRFESGSIGLENTEFYFELDDNLLPLNVAEAKVKSVELLKCVFRNTRVTNL